MGAGRRIMLAATLLAAASMGAAFRRYRRDLASASARIRATRQFACGPGGPIEYAREGAGVPALVIHGAGGGFDQGLLLGEQLLGAGFDIIAPSRFGYLDTAVPLDASPAAQADAHAVLLDALGIEAAIVVGASAGAPSAIELALRHPQRIAALILLVPRAYSPGGPDIHAPPESRPMLDLVLAGADFPLWLAMRWARGAVVRFLGVPPAVERGASRAERRRVTRIMASLLPLARRLPGLRVDGDTPIGPQPIARITAPTLAIGARDDLYSTLPAAVYLARTIAGAELMVADEGGHLLVGQTETLRARVMAFLTERGCGPARP